ncbi:TetR/AcrR family transcriptional regulator [Sphingomonas sp. CL5.1]|uniref:TetR family transcriptional regulator n=1 Tax=Sphingomonas sp. CL5.1 TaxID=2653203 RepID=UPI0015837941|nr:TetR family transcriptional regulator [Sphingomonas sp. CL5.1]QKR99492.1 TetR/AcrR family transcriptional regulator [Sphingomonas sp. CL5.1]
MTADRNTRVSTRKEPIQARSNLLVEAVLDAAVQVLAKEGAQRFTTARVAERAGVSVGSLYQYFPNKAAILFRLQSDEWRRTSALLKGILEDRATPPTARLRRLVHAFILSECEEAAIRTALSDAAPLYRDAPEAIEAKRENTQIFRTFLAEALPGAPADALMIAGDLIKMTLSEVGSSFSETSRTAPEIAAWSEALADMLCAYLERLSAKAPPRPIAC